MYLPELNREDARVLELNAFGGINRKLNAQTGELAEAVNMSADEYPLLKTRQSYDVGLFEPFAAMWHNNDRDMALVSVVDPEKALYITDPIEAAKTLENNTYKMVFVGDEGKDLTIGNSTYYFVPNTVYQFTVESGVIVSKSVSKVTSYIVYDKESIPLPPYIHYFKNPVTANIGTSTVICDEINGMWVLEYDKDTNTYTYNKVQNKYEVHNEEEGTSAGGKYIVGGNYCHLRCWFDDNTMIKNIVWTKNEEEFNNKTTAKDSEGNYEYANYIIAYGANAYKECLWYRLRPDGSIEPVDFLHYEFCTLEGSMKFREGDYVELKMSGIWGRSPNLEEELKRLDGYYDVVKIRENDDGVKFSLMLKGPISSYGTINALIMKLGAEQKKGETTLNNKYLDKGMSIERKAPENVRFICSHQNRIWANNGDNEIMCCARGNPYVWYRYEGNALDSWAATVGGDGKFTGCINFGYPLFFKENRMLRVSGSRPSNFGYNEYSMKGIKEGCHDSAVIVNDVLYYQGMDGVYAYGGSTPQKISEKVYKGRWTEGKACRYRDKYILCVTEGDEQSVYVYDTTNGLWHRDVLGDGKVRYLYPGSYLHDHAEAMTIYTDNEDGSKFRGYVITDEGINEYDPEKPIEWEFETTELINTCEYKYLKCVRIKCRPLEDGEFSVYRERDGAWKELGREVTRADKVYWYTKSFGVERTSSIKLKMSGVGRIVIDKIILEYEEGSTER